MKGYTKLRGCCMPAPRSVGAINDHAVRDQTERRGLWRHAEHRVLIGTGWQPTRDTE